MSSIAETVRETVRRATLGRVKKRNYSAMIRNPVFKHLMVRAEVSNPPTDVDAALVDGWLIDFIDKIGMKLLAGPVVRYVDAPGNKGMTATALIETSHIAMHFWDEPRPAILHFDVFTCGEWNPGDAIEALRDFGLVSYQYRYFDREHGFVEEEIQCLANQRREYEHGME